VVDSRALRWSSRSFSTPGGMVRGCTERNQQILYRNK
jgi:hypothetical protein